YDGVNPWTASTCCSGGVPLAQADIAPASASLAVDKTLGRKSISIVSLVQDEVNAPASNFGLLLNSDATRLADRYRTFASMENATVALRPSLTVTYTSSGTPPPPLDTTPPAVSMTAPAGGSTVSGSAVAVSATASDNVA